MVKKQPKLSELQESIEKLVSEVRKLRLEINHKKQPKPQQATITNPEWCYEFPPMTIDLSVEEWSEVRKGTRLTLKGRGYKRTFRKNTFPDEFLQDYWHFNEESLGRITIDMGTPDSDQCSDTAYVGNLDSCEIIESDAPTKTKTKLTK